MPVIFSEQGIIETSHEQLLAAGFRCLNTGTVFEFYVKDGEDNVYLNTHTKVFFKNPNMDNNSDNMTKLKIIVAGGRDLKDYDLVKRTLDHLLRKRRPEELEIVCGEAAGADSLGKRYAIENGIKVMSFPADWDSYGLSAGPRRNGEMARYATHCVCFWDGRSRGTKNMISQATEKGLVLKVVRYS